MIVVGASVRGMVSGVVAGAPAFAGSSLTATPEWVSTDEAGAGVPDWLSSCGLAAAAGGGHGGHGKGARG